MQEREYTLQNKGVIGLFRTRQEAERCIDALLDSGFNRSQMSVVMHNPEETKRFERETGVKETHAAEGATSGAGAGAVLGGAAGLMAGLGLMTIPGIGPLLALGPIATALAGAGVGGVTGGVVGALVGLGIPEEEAKNYATRIKEGNILLSVECGDQCDRVRSTMTRYASFDVRDFAGQPTKGIERHRTEPYDTEKYGTEGYRDPGTTGYHGAPGHEDEPYPRES